MMATFFKVIFTVLSVGFVYWLVFGWDPALSLMLPVLTLSGCIALKGPTGPSGASSETEELRSPFFG